MRSGLSKLLVAALVLTGAARFSPASAQTSTTVGGFPAIVTGTGPGGGPHVKVFDVQRGELNRQFFAYDAAFRGGVRVAVGDVDGDGVGDLVTAPGPGGGPHVKVFSGKTGALIEQFFAYPDGFTGGVFVATLDFNEDGKADVVTGADAGGGPQVVVWDLRLEAPLIQANFFAYDAEFFGGVRVAAADVDGDGAEEVVTAPGIGGGPHVRVFHLNEIPGSIPTPVRNIFPEDAGYRGGLFVGASNDASGTARIVTTLGSGDLCGSSFARTYDASGTQIGQTTVQPGAAQSCALTVALGNLDSDGADEIVAGFVKGSTLIARDIHGTETKFATDAYPGFGGPVFVAAGRM